MTDSKWSASEGGKHAPRDPFTIGLDDRYDRLKLIGWWDQQLLSRAKILVVGAGALGNEVVKNLALVGAGQILIIDFDRIELSNLSRSVLFRAEHQGRSKAEVAAEMARQLNPDCQIVGWQGDVLTDVGLGLVRDANVVIGCVDNREARLWINRMCWKVGTPWIDGGIQEINGVCKVFVPGDGGCYECAMTENDYRLIQLRYSCPLLSRDDLQQGKVPTAPTIAAIIGGLQVQEALKLLHRKSTQSGTAIVFNGDSNQCYLTRYPVRDDCLSHEHYAPIMELDIESDRTVAALFAGLNAAGIRAQQLELDRDWLIELICSHCGNSQPVEQPMSRVTQRQANCDKCGHPRQPRTIHEVEQGGPWDHKTLCELGIPRQDIVKVRGNNQLSYVRLAGDQHVSGNRIWS